MLTTPQRQKLLIDVFNPQPNEKILLLTDIAHDNIITNQEWEERHHLLRLWEKDLKNLSKSIPFNLEYLEFPATGQNNSPLSKHLINQLQAYNLILAMTEFSASSSLKPLCHQPNSNTRCASMPGISLAMEDSALLADYAEVKKYALSLQTILNKSTSARIQFSTGDELHLDLRFRTAQADKGECNQAGQFINFPSGEAFKVPYEATPSEIETNGISHSQGTLPVKINQEIIKLIIEENQIVDIVGSTEEAKHLRAFFHENNSRCNIAELGLGCNPQAIVTGNILEDEKVGLHIAYGTSTHLGGQILSDVHEDIVFAQGCPVEGVSLILFDEKLHSTEIIVNSQLQYHML